MDPRAQRAWWLTMLVFGAVGVALTVGIFFVDFNSGWLAEALAHVRGAWWSPIAVTLVFTVLAFIGAPQIALIAATTAVFGAAEGIVLSWLATMISAGVGYGIGRAGGKQALERLEGKLIERLLRAVQQNGFLAAAMIRIIPSGPFILVNLALGATGMRASWFFGGTGLGIVPKILVIAFAGQGVSQLFDKQNVDALYFLLGAAAIWAGVVFVLRPMMVKRQSQQD